MRRRFPFCCGGTEQNRRGADENLPPGVGKRATQSPMIWDRIAGAAFFVVVSGGVLVTRRVLYTALRLLSNGIVWLSLK